MGVSEKRRQYLKDYLKKWESEHKEQRDEYKKQWARNHREQRNAYMREYRARKKVENVNTEQDV